ncbi:MULTISPECIES: CDP-diacylglycerol--serine O-phosphatidyltransferase [Prosthecochloris]|uniref:CDP-diacylglycerol--serine O-phosphatidyltransferase n=1 Tax=Prosthecochloris vibrioformis TaxID=1098 RepID=A0A5C4S1J1_PROVB|nr:MULTISPECIES: CDP-diacylglycerol--serine O-phosphatidyltransferase [Prosthecochloris]ANT64518.1 CDP-diacylglycerol-serine O-phosphatidyltransferase [Prosthecochloris sp. CIB 2401]TNJ37356.1 CDP-diacylglycerol--serine O-phosphatidyltransferase [Prosthecochloris vibrioformis]
MRSPFPASYLPSLLTLMNMLCGYASLIMSGAGSLEVAGWLIIIAACLDGADGFVARLTRSESQFGGQLDSLADLVSFGIAPSYLAYAFGFEGLGIAGVLLSFLIVLGAALRLARFNIGDAGSSTGAFIGLPSPAAAVTLASFVIWMLHEPGLFSGTSPLVMLSLLCIMLAVLMQSRITYGTLPRFSRASLTLPPLSSVLWVAVVFCLVICQAKAFFLFMLLYILQGVFNSLRLLVRETVL